MYTQFKNYNIFNMQLTSINRLNSSKGEI